MADITIRAGTVPGRFEDYVLPEGTTLTQVTQRVQERLQAADPSFDIAGYDVRLHNTTVLPDAFRTTVLQSGDNVVIVKKIKGNRFFALIRRLFGFR